MVVALMLLFGGSVHLAVDVIRVSTRLVLLWWLRPMSVVVGGVSSDRRRRRRPGGQVVGVLRLHVLQRLVRLAINGRVELRAGTLDRLLLAEDVRVRVVRVGDVVLGGGAGCTRRCCSLVRRDRGGPVGGGQRGRRRVLWCPWGERLWWLRRNPRACLGSERRRRRCVRSERGRRRGVVSVLGWLRTWAAGQ